MKFIELTQGFVALVDDADYENVNQYKWRVWRNKKRTVAYAVTGQTCNDNFQSMHQFLMGTAPEGLVWDHIDLDGLNNQRSNLRLATRSQNVIHQRARDDNKTGCKGLAWVRGQWEVRLGLNNKRIYIGGYPTKAEAIAAYNEAAKKYHGEFAVLFNEENQP